MARTKSTFESFQFNSNTTTIQEAGNISRWKPRLAIEWMEEVLPKCQNPLILEYWNFTAKIINKTIDSIERAAYTNINEYWENTAPKRLELQSVEYDLKDWFAMQAFLEAK